MNGLTKKIAIFVVVMAAVAAFGWIGRKAWKHYTERNLIAQAQKDFANKDLKGADLCLRRVMQINPMSVQGSRMIANLLDAEDSPASISWRIRVVKLEPDNVTNRYAWVDTALHVKNLPSASEALASVPVAYKSSEDYHKLASAVAWSSGRLEEAQKECATALQMDPTNCSIQLNLATIQLAFTNTAINELGRAALNKLTTDPTLGMLALHHLQADAVEHKHYEKALGYSSRIVSRPEATYGDRVEHLQLLRTTKSADADAWLANLEKTAQFEPANAYALARWMILAQSPGYAYQWLCTLPPNTQTNLAIELIKTDCQIGMKDWNGLLAAVNSQDWGAQKSFYRQALIALAQRSLGQDAQSQASWQRALHLASEEPQNLALLSQVTAMWGWFPERVQTLQEVMDRYPDQTWAPQQLTAQLYSQGNTQALVDLLTKMQSANPADPRLKNNLANVLLLRRSDLEKACRLASEAYLSATNNPFFISTYAFSLLVEQKPDQAQKIIATMNPEFLKIPSVAAYYGVIEANTGHTQLAREPLNRAAKAGLLPEEKAMVQNAIAHL